MNIVSLLLPFMLLLSNTENAYQNAQTKVLLELSSKHEYVDSIIYCDGKIKSVLLRDSVLNKPNTIGNEYNYPIYKFETEIVYYKDGKIASFEKKELHFKRYSDGGVTTGIQITTTLEEDNIFYFDQNQKSISRTELMKIEQKICKEKE